MTQPNTVNQTFDISLVDLNTSFSTTESDPVSDTGIQATSDPSTLQKKPSSTQHIPTVQSNVTSKAPLSPAYEQQQQQQLHLPTEAAYDQWSSIYDTDGNMLQAIDDIQLATLLPSFLSTVLANKSANPSTQGPDVNTTPQTLSFIDLGCGTGRNTEKLLMTPHIAAQPTHITGLDFSAGMLSLARTKLSPLTSHTKTLRLERVDCFPSAHNPTASPKPAIDIVPADALLSTLVLEHVPLAPFFATVSSLLVHGGYALVTNMHGDMGRVSQAGFVNADGVKIRGDSHAHTMAETVNEAVKAGFEVLRVEEREVRRDDVESGRVGARGAKWIGVNVWYGLMVRKVS